MAGKGRAPSGTRSRPRDQKRREAELTVVESDGKAHGPELPDGYEWPDETLAWWDSWRRCAQASTFTDTDWDFLIDTAVLHADFWLGNRSVAGELRLRAAKFGATPEDRARLKLEVGEPASKPRPKKLPKKAKDRRTRLLKAVGEDGE